VVGGVFSFQFSVFLDFSSQFLVVSSVFGSKAEERPTSEGGPYEEETTFLEA
jgi:hypothetical protein